MRYTSRATGPLTTEERDVRAALKSYAGSGGRTDWVPASCIQRVYRTWHAQQNRPSFDPLGPARLTMKQFGRAVCRVYPGVRRVRRRVCKRNTWGYAGLAGPLSLKSEWVGRRPATRFRHRWQPVTAHPQR